MKRKLKALLRISSASRPEVRFFSSKEVTAFTSRTSHAAEKRIRFFLGIGCCFWVVLHFEAELEFSARRSVAVIVEERIVGEEEHGEEVEVSGIWVVLLVSLVGIITSWAGRLEINAASFGGQNSFLYRIMEWWCCSTFFYFSHSGATCKMRWIVNQSRLRSYMCWKFHARHITSRNLYFWVFPLVMSVHQMILVTLFNFYHYSCVALNPADIWV